MYSETVSTYIQTELTEESIRIDLHFSADRLLNGLLLKTSDRLEYCDHIRHGMTFDPRNDHTLPLIARKVLHELEMTPLRHDAKLTGVTAATANYSATVTL